MCVFKPNYECGLVQTRNEIDKIDMVKYYYSNNNIIIKCFVCNN